MNIDELTGHDLNVAVAQALGWVQGEGRKNGIWWASDGTHHRRIPLENESASGASYMFDPARDIATALDELDGGCWSFDKAGDELEAWISSPGNHASVIVNISDFPSASIACATAFCRVWLKAQAAQSIEGGLQCEG